MTHDDLARIFEHPAPFATVVLASPSAAEDAAERLRIEWKNARRQLAEAEMPDEILDELETQVGRHHDLGESLAAVAAADGLALVRGLPVPVEQPVVRAGELPHLVPMIAAEQSTRPYVAVITDREGADVWSHGPDGDVRQGEVHGDTEHIHKGHPGGWSQRRFQQRAENTWEANAKQVAAVVTREVKRVDAHFVAIAGDTKARGYLEEHMPNGMQDLVRHVDTGGRNLDGSHQKVEEEIVRLIADDVAAEKRDLLRTFDEERGQDDRAADGPARTLEALAQARVETLLVPHRDDLDGRTAFFGPEPTQVGIDAGTVKATGIDDPREAPLVDVAVRAALLTGAEVRTIPGSAATGPNGIGAILRF